MKCHDDIRLQKPLLLFTLLVILLSATLVHAAKRSVYFTPNFKLTVEPRKGKAQIADRSEESLMKSGYIPIGLLEITYLASQANGPKGPKTYNYPKDPTKDLQKWAAKKGGDVIRVSDKNVPTDGTVTWSKIVKRTKYSGTKYTYNSKAKYMSSFATVYRKDPALERKILADKNLLRKLQYVKGNILYRNKKYFGAQFEYSKALEIDPGYIDAYIASGIAKMGYNFHIGAIGDFSKVIELNPKNPIPYYHRGHSRLLFWDTTNAILDLMKYLSLDSKKTEAYYLLGIAYERQNQIKAALQSYRYFIENAEIPRLDSLVEDAVIRVSKIRGKSP